MSESRYFFDYVDPFSYLQELEISALEGDGKTLVRRIPLEMNPPPAPLLDPDEEGWRRRWDQAADVAETLGVGLTPPRIVPWTRKAHELVLLAGEKGLAREMHAAVFRAVFAEGADVGRVDVLVDIARELGFDANDTKAALDVDRLTASVEELRNVARMSGIEATPALAAGGQTLQGFHNRDAVRTFLRLL